MFKKSLLLLILSQSLSKYLMASSRESNHPRNRRSIDPIETHPCKDFGNDWSYHRGSCYKIFNEDKPIKKAEAQTKCKEINNNEVPELTSTNERLKRGELHFIMKKLVDNSTDLDPIWVGTMLNDEGRWFTSGQNGEVVEEKLLKLNREPNQKCLTISRSKEHPFAFRDCFNFTTKRYLCKVAVEEHRILHEDIHINNTDVHMNLEMIVGAGFKELILRIDEP